MIKLTFPLTMAAVFLSQHLSAAEIRRAERPIAGRYIVLYKDSSTATASSGQTADELTAERHKIHEQYGGRVDRTWRHTVKGFSVRMTDEQAKKLANDPKISHMEEDGIMQAQSVETSPGWGLDRIDQRQLPLDSLYTYEANGSGVTVYVIDSGIQANHTEFEGRIGSGLSRIADGRGISDCYGHGTHMAGIVGGATYGVAKGVKLVPMRVLDCKGNGPTSNVIAAVEWLTRNRVLPAVANLSLNGNTSAALDAAVQKAVKAGVTFTVAAGNAATNACKSSPARVPEALTVGAINTSDQRASFSNFGNCLDLFAPGVNILSAWAGNPTATNKLNGTSPATAHVAGAAALVLSSQPSATPAEVAATIINSATTGQVSNIGSNSPNRLLYTNPYNTVITPPLNPVTAPPISTPSSPVTPPPFIVPPIFPVATGGTTPAQTCSTSSQLLLNGGFETGNTTPWITSSGVISKATTIKAHTGSWEAWLNGYGSSHTDFISRQLIIPANICSATLSFWLHIVSTETSTTAVKDLLKITAENNAGNQLTELGRFSNLNTSPSYLRKTYDLTPYKGQTINLKLTGIEDASGATSFVLDDLAVEISQ